MSDHATRQAKRSGDLAAQLAAEVRAGRPERARLRAYCGCEAARFVVGLPYQPAKPPRHWEDRCIECDDLGARILGPDSRGDPILDLCSCTLPEYQDLPDWLTGLQRLAWAPPLWVPCSTCGCGADCPTLSSHPATVDPAQWVLAVAACGVARATYAVWRLAPLGGDAQSGVILPTKDQRNSVVAAIEAAEQWARCPCSECASNAANLARRSGHSHTVFGAPARACVGQVTECIENLVRSDIGPDAAREAAARAVLEVV